MLDQVAITEFKEIYQLEFGEELSDQHASDLATSFLNLMREIYKPVPEENEHENNNRIKS